MEVVKGGCCVYALEYHLVWCTKYRRKVLTAEIEAYLRKVLEAYVADNRFSILEMNGGPDHIHLLISASPMVFIPDIMKGMKGVSARGLFEKFPGLKGKLWGGHMWNPTYFAATVSENTEEQVRRYIQSQKEK